MKNSIPLILAVLLGLAAVFAVSKIISTNTARIEETVKIVAATRDLSVGEVIAEGPATEEAVLSAELDLQAEKEYRKSFPVLDGIVPTDLI